VELKRNTQAMNMSTPQPAFAPSIVGIGGTARPGSTSERAVAQALLSAERLGATTKFFDGEFVSRMPLFVPERVIRNADEREFIDAIRGCHGVIVGTPGYHGSLSGPIKNMLDLLEYTRQDERLYLDGCAFGCVVTAHGWQACGTTLVALRSIAHSLRAWPTPFGAVLNASEPLFDAEGACIGENVSKLLSLVAFQVVQFARCFRAGASLTNDLARS
jgi:FMN reductase